MAVWVLILALMGALFYFNHVGLPGFVKKPLLAKLRARGVDLQFSRLRLRWHRGLVAENVRFGRADQPLSPELTVREVQVGLDRRALARLRLQVDCLMLRQGRLVWPLPETNQPRRQLSVEAIQTELRFLPDDQWALDQFQADFAGAKFQLSGTVLHASAVRQWKFFQGKERAPFSAWQEWLRQLAVALERIHFSVPPELLFDVRGDARDIQSFQARLLLKAPGADTPWGTVDQGRFTARLAPMTNQFSRVTVRLEAAGAQTRWATITNLFLTAQLTAAPDQTNLISADLNLAATDAQTRWATSTNFQLKLAVAALEDHPNLVKARLVISADRVTTKWANATNATFTAQWLHALTNPVPLSGEGQFQCDQADTQWAAGKKLQLLGRLIEPVQSPPFSTGAGWPISDSAPEAAWDWCTKLQPYRLEWECHLAEVQAAELAVQDLACGGTWRAPELTLTELRAKVPPGQIEASAALNVATRALKLLLASDADPHKIAPLLTAGAQRWLADYSWDKPPELKAEVALVLPAWTNGPADWRTEVQPTIDLQGEFKLEHGGAYRQVTVTSAQAHFSYSNLCWQLPDLTATRPEGRLTAEHRANDRTQEFYWRLSSTFDPRCLRPLLETNHQRGLDLFTFTEPPVIDAEIQGCFHDPERLGFQGRVALTNFTFRGESFTGVQTTVQYTNQFLLFTNAHVQRGAQRLSAEGLGADFRAQQVFLTNGFSTAEPLVVARAIGPKPGHTMEPYRFSQPPTVSVQGVIPMHGDDADLHFDVDGGPFHWWRFNVPHLSGHIHWLGQRLTLSDMRVDFYGGKAAGWAQFDFRPRKGADYQFAVTTTNTLLQPLVSDLTARTNRLEGLLSGGLVITKANTVNQRQFEGYGEAALRDGWLWDIPLFGIFSPVLDSLVPGLGTSHASAATGTYVITNSLVRSDDLEIRSTAMRLLYRGTVSIPQGQVNARVEAELLRDMWLLGPLVSTVFWPVTKMFEYKVTGTLGQPKTEPLYLIPKIVLLPLHPLRTIKELFPEDSTASQTNAPPQK